VSRKRMVTEAQAKELAELYVFGTVVCILEGPCAPQTRSGKRVAHRIIALCHAEQAKRIRFYDNPSSEIENSAKDGAK